MYICISHVPMFDYGELISSFQQFGQLIYDIFKKLQLANALKIGTYPSNLETNDFRVCQFIATTCLYYDYQYQACIG